MEAAYGEVETMLRSAGPAILFLPGSGPRFLAILAAGRGKLTVLGADLRRHRLPLADVRSALCRPLEAPLLEEVDTLLDRAAVPERRRLRARSAILHERLSPVRIGNCWLLRHSPGASFGRQLRTAGLLPKVSLFLGAHTVQYLLWLLSWYVIGRGALEGRL